MKSAKNGSVTTFIINNEIKQLRYNTENETKIDLTRCHTLILTFHTNNPFRSTFTLKIKLPNKQCFNFVR